MRCSSTWTAWELNPIFQYETHPYSNARCRRQYAPFIFHTIDRNVQWLYAPVFVYHCDRNFRFTSTRRTKSSVCSGLNGCSQRWAGSARAPRVFQACQGDPFPLRRELHIFLSHCHRSSSYTMFRRARGEYETGVNRPGLEAGHSLLTPRRRNTGDTLPFPCGL